MTPDRCEISPPPPLAPCIATMQRRDEGLVIIGVFSRRGLHEDFDFFFLPVQDARFYVLCAL